MEESREPTDHRRAEDLFRSALEVFHRQGATAWAAETQNRLARLYRKQLEDPRRAMGHYRAALGLFEQLGEPGRQGGVWNQIGRLHFVLGEIEAAQRAFEQAVTLGEGVGDRGLVASARANLAQVYRYQGDYRRVLVAYDTAVEFFRESGDLQELGTAFHNRARLYEALGQTEQALADLERALTLGRELDRPDLLAMALTARGRMESDGGRPEEALGTLRAALEQRRRVGRQRGLAVTLAALASVYEQLGRPRQAIDAQSEALAVFRELEARREVARAQAMLGRLAAAEGRYEEAGDLFARAVETFRRLGDIAGEIDTRWSRARAERARGRTSTALAQVEELLEDAEDLRRRVPSHDLRRSYFAARQQQWDFYVDLLMEVHRDKPGAGFDRRALEASERSRSRSLVDLIHEDGDALPAGVDAELLAREADLRQRLALVEVERLNQLDHNAPDAAIEMLTDRLDELLRQLRAVQGEIRFADPRHAALMTPRTVTVEEIQDELLDADTVLLEYHLGEERSFLWRVTRGSVVSFELPPRAEIEDAVRRVRELIEPGRRRRYRRASARAWAQLGEVVLGPLGELPAGRRLLIAGEGALRYVPFSALPLPGGAAVNAAAEEPPPLVSGHEIVHTPSASALASLRRRSTGRSPPSGLLAVIADPVVDRGDPRLGEEVSGGTGSWDAETGETDTRLARLPHSGEEARALLEMAPPERRFAALGFAATREAATDPALGEYRIVHLATHGEIDSRRPELSWLMFSRFDARGRVGAGRLWAYQVFDLRWLADLVVLSGCETALGREIRGEGLVGLTQGFFHAGAGAVLVSLWRVEDRATAELMIRFYWRLLRAGQPPATALRAAQLDLRRDPRMRAPYYWAGFVLQGDGLRPIAR